MIASTAAAGVGFLTIVLLAVACAMYLIPTWVALIRHHTQAGAIFAINLLLGWTLLGWAGALAWACSTSKYMPSHPARKHDPLDPWWMAPPPNPRDRIG
jgi:hypothetical protein